MKHIRATFVLLCAVLLIGAHGQCSSNIKAPCSCSSTRYEPVAIVCDGADSLEDVLKALANPPLFIDSLTISNTPIIELPGQVFQGLAVKKLVLRSNGLQRIAHDAFEGVMADYTQELEIRSNKLNEVPQSGISQLRSLQSLVLSDNEIHTIPENIFLTYHSRSSLSRLDLSANNISSISEQGFLGLQNLQQLSLDKNRFTEIPTAALELLTTLEDLGLGVNAIREVRIGALPLPKLKSLSLEVNEIASIESDTFKSVPNLLYLYLSNNKFTKIYPSTFYYLSKLKVLAMSNNRISRIREDDLKHISALVRLELSDCFINNVEDGALQKIPRIQVIVLSRNQLTRIHQSMFGSLYQLVSLDLRNNEINKVDDFAFSRLRKLHQLDLSGNKLANLPKDVFYNTFQELTSIDDGYVYLNDNTWHCDSKIAWLQKWILQSNLQFAPLGSEEALCASPGKQKGARLAGVALEHAEKTSKSELTPKTTSTTPSRFPSVSSFGRQMIATTTVLSRRNLLSTEMPQQINYRAFSPLIIIIAVIALLFIFIILVVMLVRCAAERSSEKSRDDRRDLSGSVLSGYGSSTFGTGPYATDTFYRSGYPPQFIKRPSARGEAAGFNNAMNWWCY
ncbi:hypothetical protein L596_003311 [Steinernema carpocapsae]|uniref:LRRCT domain-containing protein n=1 Tax=Steinernema carpocapsae TaxID=34508 RepID=A0A4U8UTR0_STECR|nr:hypothetical protein L596_003311 [Steinernema carpocapsae]